MRASHESLVALAVHALTCSTIVSCDGVGSGGGSSSEKLVNATAGAIRGRTVVVPLGSGRVSEFLGVPFAEPPVGNQRFARPLRKQPWSGTLNATQKPYACWQPLDTTFGNFSGSVMWNPNTNMSEDCLYLNVWAPEPVAAPLPVMVWIYGGGFYSGSAALDVYDGKYLAALGGVVVVSMNYRVGALGFLRLPDGSANVTGNAGLWDQVEALRWVQANIAAFGGDPLNVTLFGESAGAASVAYHLVSPVSADLFHRAALQSGSALSNWAFMTPDNAELRYNALLQSTNCYRTASSGGGDGSDVVDVALACLRSRDAQNLTDAQWFTSDTLQFPFLPTVDGVLLTEAPAETMSRGGFKRCPLLVGVTNTEGGFYATYLSALRGSFNTSRVVLNVTADVMKTLLGESFRSYPIWPSKPTESDLRSITCRYSARTNGGDDMASNVQAVIESLGDSRFVCSVNDWAGYYAAAGQSVRYYVFNHVSKAKAWGAWTGAAHGDELDYVFGTPLRYQDYNESDRNLSRYIMTLWTTFAKTGTPEDSGMLRWPSYTKDEMAYYELSTESLSTPKIGRGGFRTDYCNFFKYCLSSSPTDLQKNIKDKDAFCSTCKTSNGGTKSSSSPIFFCLVALFSRFTLQWLAPCFTYSCVGREVNLHFVH